ncbi:MAG: tail fiber protein, partial [Thermomicrobiales bacterium]
FTTIGTAYGSGNGSTTFNVPDLRSRFPLGLDAAQTANDALGETGGTRAHTLAIGEMPSHTHYEVHTGSGGTTQIQGGGGSSGGVTTAVQTSATGGGGAHNNMPPFVTVNYIIKT